MNPVEYLKGPYDPEAVKLQRRTTLKIRGIGFWGAAIFALPGAAIDGVGIYDYIEARFMHHVSTSPSLREMAVGSLVVGIYGGLSHHGFSSWNRDTILEQQLIEQEQPCQNLNLETDL